jgi:prophage regulatory protein
MDRQPNQQLLNPKDVEARTTLSRVTLWRKSRDGDFPKPLRISSNRIAWREADVDAWITSKMGVA